MWIAFFLYLIWDLCLTGLAELLVGQKNRPFFGRDPQFTLSGQKIGLFPGRAHHFPFNFQEKWPFYGSARLNYPLSVSVAISHAISHASASVAPTTTARPVVPTTTARPVVPTASVAPAAPGTPAATFLLHPFAYLVDEGNGSQDHYYVCDNVLHMVEVSDINL